MERFNITSMHILTFILDVIGGKAFVCLCKCCGTIAPTSLAELAFRYVPGVPLAWGNGARRAKPCRCGEPKTKEGRILLGGNTPNV